MLEPDIRHLILDALRPPPGFSLEQAVGTTYSLDLIALMATPVAFAMFDRQQTDGAVREDPIALLQALRSQAERITIFCQAGQIKVPSEYRSLFVYLEQSVYPVIPPHPQSIFHPKVWYLKFIDRLSGAVRYRLLCLSRNLTFDRSWDTVLQLDGAPGHQALYPELETFGTSLIEMANRTQALPSSRVEAIQKLAQEFAQVRWTLPEAFDSIHFWPIGIDTAERWPFAGRRDRMLVISPFVTAGMLHALTNKRRGSILISRSETLDALGRRATAHLAERLVVSSSVRDPEAPETNEAVLEVVGESIGSVLEGLHAKCYVADAGRRARVWTGSANCTDAAFSGNVEFLVELEGRRDRCGVQAFLGEASDRLGLRKLLEPYEPAQDQPLEPTELEQMELLLDRARRCIGSMRFVATCHLTSGNQWSVDLIGDAPAMPIDLELRAIVVEVRPLTVGQSLAQTVSLSDSGFAARFTVSEPAITPNFVVKLALRDCTVDFLVIANLVGAPVDRVDKVLTEMLKNRTDVLRFLLLLLGDADRAFAFVESSTGSGAGTWSMGAGIDALLEPMVAAFSRDPLKLADITRFVEDLRRSDHADALLPDHWDEIWLPIAAALSKDRTP